MSDEKQKILKEAESQKIIELRAKLERELAALLAHPAVPKEFKEVFQDKEV